MNGLLCILFQSIPTKVSKVFLKSSIVGIKYKQQIFFLPLTPSPLLDYCDSARLNTVEICFDFIPFFDVLFCFYIFATNTDLASFNGNCTLYIIHLYCQINVFTVQYTYCKGNLNIFFFGTNVLFNVLKSFCWVFATVSQNINLLHGVKGWAGLLKPGSW